MTFQRRGNLATHGGFARFILSLVFLRRGNLAVLIGTHVHMFSLFVLRRGNLAVPPGTPLCEGQEHAHRALASFFSVRGVVPGSIAWFDTLR